jgi:hypothetical protein
MASLYNLAREFTVSDATYNDSARVFIALKLSKDKNDPIALFYSRFLEWRSYIHNNNRGYEARNLLRSNLTYPYILTVIDESSEFFGIAGGMTTWLDRLPYIPKVVKFSYSQGFRFIKRAWSDEDESLIRKKIETAHLGYPDNENVLQRLIHFDVANEHFEKALEEFSELIAKNPETRFLGRLYAREFYRARNILDTVLVNRFLEMVKEKYPDNPIIDYTKPYTVYFPAAYHGKLPGVPLSEFSVALQYLDSCLQKNEGFLPAYDLLLRIWCYAESDSLARSVFRKWNNPENILQKMVTIARQRGGLDLDEPFNLLTEFYIKQKKYELVIEAANRFKASDGISDVTRISRLYRLCWETQKTDFLKSFLEKNLNIDRNALAMGWEGLADYSLNHNDKISAEKYYRKAYETFPSRILSDWLNSRELFVKTGQYNKIINEHNRYSLSWWPYIKPNHEIFAWAHHKLGQEAKADSILNEIAKVAPKSASALVVRAAIAYDKGKTDEVRELLQSAKDAKGYYFDVDAQFQKLTKKQ